MKGDQPEKNEASNTSAYRLMLPAWVWLIKGPDEPLELMQQSAATVVSFQLEEVFSMSLAAGIDITALRAGLMVFNFSNWPSGVVTDDSFDERVRAQSQRVKVANAHLLCVHSTYLTTESLSVQTQRIAPRDLLSQGGGGHGGAATRIFTGLNPLEVIGASLVVPEVVLTDSLNKLDAILTHDLEFALDLVVLLHQAHVAYQEHDYSLTTVLAWTVCEALLNTKWNGYLDEQKQREQDGNSITAINSSRRSFLTSGNITANIMSEVLELSGKLPLDLYIKLQSPRKARNKWLHDLHAPSGKSAADALEAARLFINDFFGFDLQLSTGRSITG
ncbi:MAG: hypothetical protein IIC72_12635 [Acidobacteria bacterium]|nr:hypothetical protein [Acidobacteriota bacterium]